MGCEIDVHEGPLADGQRADARWCLAAVWSSSLKTGMEEARVASLAGLLDCRKGLQG